jgi:histone H3/H4
LTVARALREIKYYQKHSEQLLLPKLPFLRVVKEITEQLDPIAREHPIRWQSSAVACLQEMTEHVLVMYFELLYVLINAKLIIDRRVRFTASE